ncbi:hypothetical protein [Paenibacillus antibioticophila]|uniref:hypothetical protein n=1 Tax=Paenibacillus antibioticophila TaxID=1274374 RepID=UPI0005C89480|nr:hypothetical protein [Paenibacillus antibioticophila]
MGLIVNITVSFVLVIAAIFVLVPDHIQQTMLTISLVGLTASGAYHYSEKPNLEEKSEEKSEEKIEEKIEAEFVEKN